MEERFSAISDRLHLAQQELLHRCQSKAARMDQKALRDLITEALLYSGKNISTKQHDKVSQTRIFLTEMSNGKNIDTDTALLWFSGIGKLLDDWGLTNSNHDIIE